MSNERKTMRDAMIERIYLRMKEDPMIFFVSADLGAPMLDQVRADFPERFINIGIAEQNLINVCTGLALEGYTVYAYGIAPFVTMRSCEQVRNNLSLLGQTREVNVNIIGVGAGLSYMVSGPTHHSLEDISVMRAMPNLQIIIPSDWEMAAQLVDYTIENKSPKYIRMEGKPIERIYETDSHIDFSRGFQELASGRKVCIASTGYMTQKAVPLVKQLRDDGVKVGHVDVYSLAPLDEEALYESLGPYETVITLEEAFGKRGGLDTRLLWMLSDRNSDKKLVSLGLKHEHIFEMGEREDLHEFGGVGEQAILDAVKQYA